VGRSTASERRAPGRSSQGGPRPLNGVAEPVAGQAAGHEGRDGADAHQCEERHHPRWAIRKRQRDAVTERDASVAQIAGKPTDPTGQLLERPLPAPEADRRAFIAHGQPIVEERLGDVDPPRRTRGGAAAIMLSG